MSTLKIYSPSNFQAYNTVLLIIIKVLCTGSSGCIHLITGCLYSSANICNISPILQHLVTIILSSVHWWWECKLVQPLWKTVGSFLKKLKIELPYDAAISLLDITHPHTHERKIVYQISVLPCILQHYS